jgi:hypothetical protein
LAVGEQQRGEQQRRCPPDSPPPSRQASANLNRPIITRRCCSPSCCCCSRRTFQELPPTASAKPSKVCLPRLPAQRSRRVPTIVFARATVSMMPSPGSTPRRLKAKGTGRTVLPSMASVRVAEAERKARRGLSSGWPPPPSSTSTAGRGPPGFAMGPCEAMQWVSIEAGEQGGSGLRQGGRECRARDLERAAPGACGDRLGNDQRAQEIEQGWRQECACAVCRRKPRRPAWPVSKALELGPRRTCSQVAHNLPGLPHLCQGATLLIANITFMLF